MEFQRKLSGYRYVSSHTDPLNLIQSDSGLQYEGLMQQKLLTVKLVEQKPNPNNPKFVDCIYGIENSAGRYVEQCLAVIGCCETTCCKNSFSQSYAWAIGLTVAFCTMVLLSLIITLICWLYNRGDSKHQMQPISGSLGGISSVPSQVRSRPHFEMSMDGVGYRSDGGYYPYVGGPHQY